MPRTTTAPLATGLFPTFSLPLLSVGTWSVFRYRKFEIPGRTEDGTMGIVVRTELDGVNLGVSGRTEFLTIKAFNEWDSRFRSASLPLSPPSRLGQQG